MEIKINVEDYLSQEEIQEVITEELREYFRGQLRFYSSADAFLANVAYSTFIKAGCEAMKVSEQEFQGAITTRLIALLNDNDKYQLQLFRRRGQYGVPEDGIDTKILDSVLSKSKPIIERKVNELIENYPFREVKEDILDTIYRCIEKRLFGSKEV